MCGIAGIVHLDGTEANPVVVEHMTNIIAHRGPDAAGIHVAGAAGLGHRRLAIIDLSPAGRQPMSNEDGSIWVTFNGEIYNFHQIRCELKQRGHIFQSATDTEVIIHAYEEWGIDCVQQFNGMFAFGVWDERRQQLWLARDRLGIKPLFYCHLPTCFLFGSEIKAILCHPQVPRTLDYTALAYYLSLNYMPAPYTLCQHVRQLLPGHSLVINAQGQVYDTEYWDITYHETDNRSESEYLEEFCSLLEDAIRLRLVSDVPFGAFLSGGLDSSTVAYWMSQTMQSPVKTFSIGFHEASFNELPYAQEVATTINADHHERIVTPDAAAILPKVVWHAEEPTADSSMISVYYLAQMAREHVTMALSGDGADEILAGYETYQAYYLHRLYRMVPTWVRQRMIAPLVSALPVSDAKVSLDFKLRRFVAGGDLPGEEAHAAWRMIFDAEARREMLVPLWEHPEARADVLTLYRETFARTNAKNPLNRLLYVDTRFYLPNDMLVKIDRMTMAHALEAREPFLDHRLVEFAATVPPALKLKHFQQKKYLLKAAMRGKVPERILQRKKAGFNQPKAYWIRTSLKPFVTDHLSPERLRAMGLIHPPAVEHLLRMHFDGRADNSHQIWCLLTLSLWWQQFIEGKPAS
jgi:asparagine synthase (glutamine-hydrolysing)